MHAGEEVGVSLRAWILGRRPPGVVSAAYTLPPVIIDRDARVVPPRYPDRDVRRWMGDALGKADEADLLAVYL